MSSFKRKTGPKSELPAGTKSSPSSPATLLISTGIPSLDDILGGGLVLSCSLLILAPDAHSAYGQLVQNYFIAQGLVSKQNVFVIDENPRRIVDECMWFPAIGSVAETNPGQDTAQDENIKIAWRYGHMGHFQTTVDNNSSAEEYCRAFDLTCRIPRTVVDDALELNEIAFLDLGTLHDRPTIMQSVVEQITLTCETRGSSLKPLRICVPSLGSPAWGDLRPQDILYFLHSLRSILRQYHNVCAAVTLSPDVATDDWGGLGWTQKLGWAVDAAITLAAFTANPSLSVLFPSHHGLVHIHVLPAPHTMLTPSDKFSALRGLSSSSSLVSSGSGENNLAFKCMRKRLVFETLHLDLEGGVGERRTTPAVTYERNRETETTGGKADAVIKVMIEESPKKTESGRYGKKQVGFKSERPDIYDF